MDIKDIKIGIKVKLLSKHGLWDDYDNIEDWFDVLEGGCDALQIKKQGYGIVSEIGGCGEVWVADGISNDEWCFLPSDLEPYEEEPTSIKTPKEWLLTPSVICTTRSGREFIVISNNISVTLNSFNTWSNDLNLNYDEKLIYADDCPPNDIMKITYGKEIVWERKEEEVKEMTIDEIEKIVGSKIKIVSNK